MLYQMFNCLCRARPVILAALLAIGSPFAYAVHDDNPGPQNFELDANTADATVAPDDPNNTADDWENFQGEPNSWTGHAKTATGIVEDIDAKVFTQGSKDTKDIDQWRYRAGGSPPKADLTDAYAAAYNEGTDQVFYFGANRDSNNGTVTTGFWFFKNAVCTKPDGSFGNGESNKSGVCKDSNAPTVKHAIGDTLVVFNYDNGGKIGKTVVYKWAAAGLIKVVEATNNQLGSEGQVFCTDKDGNKPGNDEICAITNKDTTEIPWASPVPSGGFFEGGINITKVVGGSACFASFMATSRSSTTEVAEIKNFVLGNFPVCKIEVTKSCDYLSTAVDGNGNATATFTISGNVTNTGGATLYNIAVTDNPDFNSNTLVFNDCKDKDTALSGPISLDADQKVCYSAKVTLPENVSSQDDTVTAKGFISASGSGDFVPDTAKATCKAPTFDGLLEIEKECTACLDDSSGKVVVTLGYKGKVCNPLGFPVSNITVTDLVTGGIAEGTTESITIKDKAGDSLNNGDFDLPAAVIDDITKEKVVTCAYFTGDYVPANARLSTDITNTPTESPDKAMFEDKIRATGRAPFGPSGGVKSNLPVESCSLCGEVNAPCLKP